MLEIYKLKMVLYDFDDTLCIHSDHNRKKDNLHLYNANIIKFGEEVYDNNTTTSIHIKQFMQLCTALGIRQGLISASTSYKHFVSKQKWVMDKYGVELENFCVGTIKEKQDMLLAISIASEYERDEILIVDDYWKTLRKAAINGFQACSPMEIVNFIEAKK